MEYFMLKLKKLLGMLCVLSLILGLTACGTKEDNNTDITPTPTVAQDENAENNGANSEGTNSNDQSAENNTSAEGVSYPITITDSYGKEITLEQEPMKIISVGPNITEIIYALGAEKKLIGRTDYCDYPEQVLEIESIGTLYTPDIEKIVSLEPDLVISSTHFDGEDAEKLESLGIPVMGLYEEYELTGVYSMIDILGTALNKKAEAVTVVEDMKKTIDEVVASVKGLETPTVYYVVGWGEYGDFTAGENTFIGNMITLAGGDNIAKEVVDWKYNLESLVEADPDIIVVGNGEKETFCTTQGYTELTAVVEGRVYEIDRNLFDRQGYRNAEGLKVLANIFHPEITE